MGIHMLFVHYKLAKYLTDRFRSFVALLIRLKVLPVVNSVVVYSTLFEY